MGIQGVPTEKSYTEREIKEALEKHDGLISYASRELGCKHETLLAYLERHPHMMEVKDKARKGYIEKRLDVCERSLDLLVKRIDQDPSHAYKSIVYILNNHGGSRGYLHPHVKAVHAEGDYQKELLDATRTLIEKQDATPDTPPPLPSGD